MKINIILDLVDALSPNEVQKLLEFLVDKVTEIYVYDKRLLYDEYIPDNKKIKYNINDRNESDIDIFTTPMIISNDGLVFMQLLKEVITVNLNEIGLYDYQHNNINVKRDIDMDEEIEL